MLGCPAPSASERTGCPALSDSERTGCPALPAEFPFLVFVPFSAFIVAAALAGFFIGAWSAFLVAAVFAAVLAMCFITGEQGESQMM